jgi:hypothetical protein
MPVLVSFGHHLGRVGSSGPVNAQPWQSPDLRWALHPLELFWRVYHKEKAGQASRNLNQDGLEMQLNLVAHT